MATITSDFDLLEGRFTAQEARNVLRMLTDAKLRYHTERIIVSDNPEELLQSKQRIHALKALQQQLFDFIDAETQNGQLIMLHSVIQVEVVNHMEAVSS